MDRYVINSGGKIHPNALGMTGFRYLIGFFCLLLAFIGLQCAPKGTKDLTIKSNKTTQIEEQEHSIKVLAIGNSFSEDAIENHLYDLAKEKGKTIILGNLYIGGASLDLHWENMQEGHAVYDFRKIDENGVKSNRPNTSITDALQEEDWDYITVQQVSQLSGKIETIAPVLKKVVAFVRQNTRKSNPQILYHQTWAYANDATHDGFINYQRDQEKMYQAIVHTTATIRSYSFIDGVIPTGTAIQNARSMLIGNQLTRDGYHLSEPLGRYVAACTWYIYLFGKGNDAFSYMPDGITREEAALAQKAAEEANKEPFRSAIF
jgi:hypothetical protein